MVRVSQRLRSRWLQSALQHSEGSAWYKSSWKHPKIGVFLKLLTARACIWLALSQRVLMAIEMGSSVIDNTLYDVQSNASTTPYTKFRTQPVLYTQEIPARVRLLRHSRRAADVASTARSMSMGRWLLVACFSRVKNHNVSGPHLFPSVTTHAEKSLSLPRTVLQRANKSLCNRSQFRTLFLPHRFIKIRPCHQRPVSI